MFHQNNFTSLSTTFALITSVSLQMSSSYDSIQNNIMISFLQFQFIFQQPTKVKYLVNYISRIVNVVQHFHTFSSHPFLA